MNSLILDVEDFLHRFDSKDNIQTEQGIITKKRFKLSFEYFKT